METLLAASAALERALAGELACPVTDDAMLERYLAFFIRSGVLSAPPHQGPP